MVLLNPYNSSGCLTCHSGFVLRKEWKKGCCQIIRDHIEWRNDLLGSFGQIPCLFQDVEGCIPPGSYPQNGTFMEKFAAVESAPLVTEQWCMTHGRMCPLIGPGAESDLETAGLPCTDQSKSGKQLKEEGPTNTVSCSWK